MKPKLLFVTDLYYQSKGRVYYKEDLYLSSQLSAAFDLALCNPRAAIPFLTDVDVVLFRNTGPVIYFQEQYAAFVQAAKAAQAKVFNELSGKADMQGKQYLLDLTQAGYPVIPSVDQPDMLERLPSVSRYIAKPKWGADSIGLRFLQPDELTTVDFASEFVQPAMDFVYELSFYFINETFQYALYAPNPEQRWKLESYQPTTADLDYAQQFIAWNDIAYGIQRIDACRMPNGELYLMEIEDLNPYLSLDLLPDEVRNRFVEQLTAALTKQAGQGENRLKTN